MSNEKGDNFWVAVIVLGVFLFFGVIAPHIEALSGFANMRIDPDLTATRMEVMRTKLGDSYTDKILVNVKSWYAGVGPYTVEFKDTTTPNVIARANVAGMSADQTRIFEVHYLDAPKQYTLQITIDKNNEVKETDDIHNNVLTRVVTENG